jgi:MFS transporter, DHA1 family, staphyloferrin A biosynthesis exporter
LAVRHRAAPPAASADAAPAAVATTAGGARFFGAVAHYPVFRRFWLGALAASVGQWMQQVALGWLAIVMTESQGFVGIVTFSAGLPFLVVAPFGGSLIDRLDRRRLMLTCQALAFLLATVMAFDVMMGLVQPWHLPIAAFLNGSLQALLIPNQQALVPALLPRAVLTNGIGLMSAGQNMTRVVGPSIAGVVIGAIGVGPTFLAQAAALAVAFALVITVVLPPRPPRSATGRGVFDGIRLIASRPDLRGLFLLASIPTLFVFPYIGFLNVFALDVLHIGAEGLGLLMATSGAGAVVGSLLVASVARTEGNGRVLLGLTVLYGVPIVAVALSRTLWVTLPMLFLAGVLGAAFMSGNNAMIQHRVSDDIRGRVMGAYMLTWGFMPLGSLPMGMVADRVGITTAVAAGAIVSSVLAAVYGLRSSVLRAL